MSLDLVNTLWDKGRVCWLFGMRVEFAGCLQMWLVVMRRTQWLPGKSRGPEVHSTLHHSLPETLETSQPGGIQERL